MIKMTHLATLKQSGCLLLILLVMFTQGFYLNHIHKLVFASIEIIIKLF